MDSLLIGYRMMGTLFLLHYLTCLSFPNFPQSVLLVFNPRLPVVGKRKTKEKQSESMAGQIGEVEETWERRLVMSEGRKSPLPPVDGWL